MLIFSQLGLEGRLLIFLLLLWHSIRPPVPELSSIPVNLSYTYCHVIFQMYIYAFLGKIGKNILNEKELVQIAYENSKRVLETLCGPNICLSCYKWLLL